MTSLVSERKIEYRKYINMENSFSIFRNPRNAYLSSAIEIMIFFGPISYQIVREISFSVSHSIDRKEESSFEEKLIQSLLQYRA